MDPLRPSAYAPYRDPRDYILSWTDTIWIDRAIGRLSEHYREAIKVIVLENPSAATGRMHELHQTAVDHSNNSMGLHLGYFRAITAMAADEAISMTHDGDSITQEHA